MNLNIDAMAYPWWLTSVQCGPATTRQIHSDFHTVYTA